MPLDLYFDIGYFGYSQNQYHISAGFHRGGGGDGDWGGGSCLLPPEDAPKFNNFDARIARLHRGPATPPPPPPQKPPGYLLMMG